LVGFVALAVAVVGIPLGIGPLAATCASAAEGPSVALVVDFGDVAAEGAPPHSGPQVRCVPYRSGMTGAHALRDAGFSLTFDPSSGLLCSIDGYPAQGCGTRTGERQYRYWAYWKADSADTAWTYSGTGASTRIREDVTEGWRFVEGTGSPNDPQPRRVPEHVAICGPRTEPGAPAPAAPSALPGDGSATAPGAANPGPTAGGGDGSTPADAPDQLAPANDGSTSTDTAAPANATGDSVERALDAVPSSDSGSSSGAWTAVALLVLIGALGGAAFLRSRRTT
jgi:hypothetical protein